MVLLSKQRSRQRWVPRADFAWPGNPDVSKPSISGLTIRGKEQQTVSIDLIRSVASFVLVTSEGLKYMMVQSWDVGVGKRAMPQAITVNFQPMISFTLILSRAWHPSVALGANLASYSGM